MSDMYTDGTYAAVNPEWHSGDSPWKAARVADFLRKHRIAPRRVAEVGSGSGRILTELAWRFPEARFTGYEVSPQAHEAATAAPHPQVDFVLGEAPPGAGHDLVLVIDVVEHVEDCFAFLRSIKAMDAPVVFHIPLDLSAQSVVRSWPMLNLRRTVGHIHYFTKDTALALLEDCGFTVLDTGYTASRLELPDQAASSRVVAPLRRAAHRLAPDLSVRVLGGYSLLVLAR